MSERHLIAEDTQRPDEQVVRTVDVSAWGNSPTGPSVAVWKVEKSSSEDVTDDAVIEGDAEVEGNVIATPVIGNLVDGAKYHIEVTFALGDNPVLQVYWLVRCTDNRPPAAP